MKRFFCLIPLFLCSLGSGASVVSDREAFREQLLRLFPVEKWTSEEWESLNWNQRGVHWDRLNVEERRILKPFGALKRARLGSGFGNLVSGLQKRPLYIAIPGAPNFLGLLSQEELNGLAKRLRQDLGKSGVTGTKGSYQQLELLFQIERRLGSYESGTLLSEWIEAAWLDVVESRFSEITDDRLRFYTSLISVSIHYPDSQLRAMAGMLFLEIAGLPKIGNDSASFWSGVQSILPEVALSLNEFARGDEKKPWVSALKEVVQDSRSSLLFRWDEGTVDRLMDPNLSLGNVLNENPTPENLYLVHPLLIRKGAILGDYEVARMAVYARMGRPHALDIGTLLYLQNGNRPIGPGTLRALLLWQKENPREVAAPLRDELLARGLGSSPEILSLAFELGEQEIRSEPGSYALALWKICRRLAEADRADESNAISTRVAILEVALRLIEVSPYFDLTQLESLVGLASTLELYSDTLPSLESLENLAGKLGSQTDGLSVWALEGVSGDEERLAIGKLRSAIQTLAEREVGLRKEQDEDFEGTSSFREVIEHLESLLVNSEVRDRSGQGELE